MVSCQVAVDEQAIGFAGGAGTRSPLPAPPTQARGAEKRERLYRAAIARFARDGVEATRVEDVIAEVGVSWATFFRYFPRKEDVLIEAAARHFRDHVRATARAGIRDKRRNVRTVIEDSFAALTTPAEMPPELHTLALLQVVAHPARFAAMLDDEAVQPLIELITELVAAGQVRGQVRDDVPATAVGITVVAGAFFPGVQAAARGADPGPAITLALDLIWSGIGDGARKRTRAAKRG